MAQRLNAVGHEVYAPTLTGCGERSHLANRHVDPSLHVADVENLIEWEGLDDFVLVGHSYGGAVATAVADRLEDKIKALVCLDGFALRDGENIWDFNGPQHDVFLQSASKENRPIPPISAKRFALKPALRAMAEARVRPMSLSCSLERFRLSGAVEAITAKAFFYCAGWGQGPFATIRDRLEKDGGWDITSVEFGHH